MTRLTEEQIENAKAFADQTTDHMLAWRSAFAHRIAALAVQEVERERAEAGKAAEQYRDWWRGAESELKRTLDKLAQAQADERLAVANADRMTDEVAGFESMWEQSEKAHDAETEALRAQLATAKREAPSDVELPVRYLADGGVHVTHVRITPADAKRIIEMGARA